ncbi:inactivation-no-after-potential D protein [Wyeomyia smithii]|uniref:inactivation-no-after-potential D protein n=1 Tax=Wyeomyia smithii TaxID=174621 RepID=UPI002467B174|nr:inactivation-no-after-potential D protein [Wyeomyia smithii]
MINIKDYYSENSINSRHLPGKNRLLTSVIFHPNSKNFCLDEYKARSLSKLLFAKLSYSSRNDFGVRCTKENRKSHFVIGTQLRKEYYNDIDNCLKILSRLHKTHIFADEFETKYFGVQTTARQTDLFSSNESTVFLDATDRIYGTAHDSDDDTMKSIIRTSNSRLSLESIISTECVLSHNDKVINLEAQQQRPAMTVMTVECQNDLHDNDWGREREVVVIRSEKKSFGISIVGGKVNVSHDATVSGIFIKNIMPNSPADNCGLLKIGDRILMVDGVDIRHASHEHAMNIIKLADTKMVLLVQSFVKRIDDCIETSTLLRQIPPPITPCKTPDYELINKENDAHNTSTDKANQQATKFFSQTECDDINFGKQKASTDSVHDPTIDSDNSSDDDDERTLEGKTCTKAGVEIDRASAGNLKRSKEEISLDTEEEDCFGYTTNKIKKRYIGLGQVECFTIDRSGNTNLGISLAGHKDRTKLACFIAGINPKGLASSSSFEIGDEILEVNGLVLQGRSHLNVPVIIRSIVGTTLKFIVLRYVIWFRLKFFFLNSRSLNCAFYDEAFSAFNNVRTVSIKKGPAGLGIMIIEGKHAEAGQGIFVSDIQEGSMADKAKLNIGEMILAVNRDSLLGCSYETAASLLKKAEGVVVLKICNPNKTKDSSSSNNNLDPNSNKTASSEKSPVKATNIVKGAAMPKPQASPAKEIVDPSKAEIVADENTTIEINADKKSLGISTAGGSDSVVTNGVVIVDVIPDCAADRDKRLKIFDQLLEINGIKITTDMSEKQIQKIVKQLYQKVRITVYRPNSEETKTLDIELIKKPGKQLGIGFRAKHPKGVVVTDVVSGGIADSDGKLRKGDIVTRLNTEVIGNMSFEDCSTLFKTSTGKITLTVIRPDPKKRVL